MSIKIIKILRYPIVFEGSRVYVDIAKEIQHSIFGRYEISLPASIKREYALKEKTFKTHIKTSVEQYTTYVLIDKINNTEYFNGTNLYKMDPNEECARIVSLMVLEKHVFAGQEKSSSLIHYLCTYPSMQGKGYATKMLKMILNKIRCVTRWFML